LIEEHDDEMLMCTPTSDEVIPTFVTPAQEEENMVSHFAFQGFVDALFYDLENEEVLEDPLDVLNPSCYDKDNDMVGNIDESIHVGKCKWDVVGYDGDPIYDIEGHFHLLPSQISYEIAIDSNIWQQGDEMITNIFQTPEDNLMQCSHDNFQSYLEAFDEYSFEHLDLFYEGDFQLSLCSNFDKGEDMVRLK
jgi:hypothetical protein